MKKNKSNKNDQTKLKGKEGFEEYYSSLFKDRWNSLKQSFLQESVYATFYIDNC